MILGLMLAIGIWWVIQPFPNQATPVEPSDTAIYAPWISAAGGVLALISGTILLRRYLLVRNILSHGVPIRGTAEKVERFDTNSESNTKHSNTTTMQMTPTYVYYVSLRYTMRGLEHKVRLRLPHSPGTYRIKEGEAVELLALESAPHKPLIPAVYRYGLKA
ncbi:MAG: hypothetical protein RL693_2317 [Verrucomicrobiota bacterium]|jgi:hypothetical protein